ncbi:hypothetical protein VTH06DRAFT_1169 [Thermothelomyces fergusii]
MQRPTPQTRIGNPMEEGNCYQCRAAT